MHAKAPIGCGAAPWTSEGGSETGLGLRIVTVQIKEAVVSSARLWENLQKSYRAEQGRVVRLAEVAAEEAVSERETAAQQERETRRIGTEYEFAVLRASAEAQTFDRDRLRAAIDNEQTEASLRSKLIDSLPEIVDKMPTPTELRAVTIGGTDSTSLAGLVAELVSVVGAMRTSPE